MAQYDEGIRSGVAQYDEGIRSRVAHYNEGIGSGVAQYDEGIGSGVAQYDVSVVLDLTRAKSIQYVTTFLAPEIANYVGCCEW